MYMSYKYQFIVSETSEKSESVLIRHVIEKVRRRNSNSNVIMKRDTVLQLYIAPMEIGTDQ